METEWTREAMARYPGVHAPFIDDFPQIEEMVR